MDKFRFKAWSVLCVRTCRRADEQARERVGLTCDLTCFHIFSSIIIFHPVLGRNNVPVEIITPHITYMHYTHSSNVLRICNVSYLFTMFNKRINKGVGFIEGYDKV